MKKKAVIIRNVSAIAKDEVAAIVRLAELNDITEVDPVQPSRVQQFQQDILDGKGVTSTQVKGREVRDFLYETIKEKTGNDVILYLNHDAVNDDPEPYILEKLDALKPDQALSILYLGGGHGGGHDGRVDDETSGLKKASVQAISTKLHEKSTMASVVVLGSCYSAAFINAFRDLLTEEGVLLADSVECNHSGFLQTMRWVSDDNVSDFFTPDELSEQRIKSPEVYTQYQAILGSLNETVQDKYIGELEACKAEMAEMEAEISLDQIKNTLAEYPYIHASNESTLENCAWTNDMGRFCEKMKAYLASALIVDGSPDLKTVQDYVESQFELVSEKNLSKIFFYLADQMGEETVEELSAFVDEGFEDYIGYYNPDTPGAPDVKKIASEADFYQNISRILRQDSEVTSKVLSSRTESSLMKLDESTTGKPAHSCDDAYTRVGKVIDILQTEKGVTVRLEKDTRTFNQMSVMSAFNEKFTHAMTVGLNLEAVQAEEDEIEYEEAEPVKEIDQLQVAKSQLKDEIERMDILASKPEKEVKDTPKMIPKGPKQ